MLTFFFEFFQKNYNYIFIYYKDEINNIIVIFTSIIFFISSISGTYTF